MRYMQEGFTDQVPVDFELCGYTLSVPSKHVLTHFYSPASGGFQPYRERGLILVTTALERLHRRTVAVDIGANVGDTLAIIARHSTLDVICVEPSDFYLPYLRHNVTRHFTSRARILDWFVTARDDEPGRALFHWGGTAKAINKPYSEHGPVVPISRLIAEAGEVALLKIDTDGADLGIIEACLDTHEPTFPIYFELEKTNPKPDKVSAFCVQAQQFFSRMVAAGYRQAFVWDDPGRFYGRLDLSADMTVKNLLNYLTQLRHRPIWGYDICLVHDTDTALSKQLSELISEDLFVPLD